MMRSDPLSSRATGIADLIFFSHINSLKLQKKEKKLSRAAANQQRYDPESLSIEQVYIGVFAETPPGARHFAVARNFQVYLETNGDTAVIKKVFFRINLEDLYSTLSKYRKYLNKEGVEISITLTAEYTENQTDPSVFELLHSFIWFSGFKKAKFKEIRYDDWDLSVAMNRVNFGEFGNPRIPKLPGSTEKFSAIRSDITYYNFLYGIPQLAISLKYLDLSGNPKSHAQLPQLFDQKFQNLTTLKLKYCSMLLYNVDFLKNFPLLETVDLSDNFFTVTTMLDFRYLRRLKCLKLENFLIYLEEIKESSKELVSANFSIDGRIKFPKSLKYLGMRQSFTKDPSKIEYPKGLVSLALCYNDFTDLKWLKREKFENLAELNLRDNEITSIKEIHHLKDNFKILNFIGCTHLNLDAESSDFSQFRNLTDLYLPPKTLMSQIKLPQSLVELYGEFLDFKVSDSEDILLLPEGLKIMRVPQSKNLEFLLFQFPANMEGIDLHNCNIKRTKFNYTIPSNLKYLNLEGNSEAFQVKFKAGVIARHECFPFPRDF